jgi:hypothetical protein
MYSKMRGSSPDMFGCCSLEAQNVRVLQEEQTNKSQVLHGGQEQLRRNIKVAVHRGPGNDRGGGSIAVPHAKEKLQGLWDVMTRRRQQGAFTELSRAQGRWTLEVP